MCGHIDERKVGMNPQFCRITLLLVTYIFLQMTVAIWSLPAEAQQTRILDLRPIKTSPKPLTNLHPKLLWMTKQKIRAIWIGDDLFSKFGNTDKTKAEILADAGFNLACVGMSVNTDGKPAADPTKPYDVKHDRSRSTDLETRLASNLKEARRVGLKMMIIWKYGTSHLEPYRKFRSAKGEVAKLTCCPLDEKYIMEQHVGKWAEMIVQGGADGVILDMEMYQSDTAWPDGPCMCDDCFAGYLKKYAKNWKATYDQVAPENRGKWLGEQKADAHYRDFTCKQMESMNNSLRARCQKHNPTFFFGLAPVLYLMPGPTPRAGAPVERGLGTARVPCLVFSEYEYPLGPYRGSYMSVKEIRESLPALFLPGSYVAVVPPQQMADTALMSSLYCGGWWAWYGTALLTNIGAGESPGIPYGRVKDTSARDYLDKITAAHAKLDKLLALPKNQWPERMDGMPGLLKKRIEEAEAEAAKSDSAEAKKAVTDAKAALDDYLKLVKQGGY